jgi:hypothetical protein
MRFLGPGGDLSARAARCGGFDRIVAAGGDGTVSGVCYAVAGSGVPVLPYPAGTANLFALNMRIPADPHELARLTVQGNARDVDLGEITYGAGDRRGFVVAAGAGFDANIMESADRLKPTLGTAAYLVGALQNLTPKVARFKLTIDGTSIESEGIAALVMNVARIQFDLALTHTSDPSDGLFEVVIVRTRNVPGLIPTVWGAFLDRFVQKPGTRRRPRGALRPRHPHRGRATSRAPVRRRGAAGDDTACGADHARCDSRDRARRLLSGQVGDDGRPLVVAQLQAVGLHATNGTLPPRGVVARSPHAIQRMTPGAFRSPQVRDRNHLQAPRHPHLSPGWRAPSRRGSPERWNPVRPSRIRRSRRAAAIPTPHRRSRRANTVYETSDILSAGNQWHIRPKTSTRFYP